MDETKGAEVGMRKKIKRMDARNEEMDSRK